MCEELTCAVRDCTADAVSIVLDGIEYTAPSGDAVTLDVEYPVCPEHEDRTWGILAALAAVNGVDLPLIAHGPRYTPA